MLYTVTVLSQMRVVDVSVFDSLKKAENEAGRWIGELTYGLITSVVIDEMQLNRGRNSNRVQIYEKDGMLNEL